MELMEETKQSLSYISEHPVASLSEEQFLTIYDELINLIGIHNKLYYIDSAPIISDSQYDELFAYVKTAEEMFPHMIRGDSPTQRLTYQLQENFQQAEHLVPLLSLENSYNAEDLKSWNESLQNIINKHTKLKNSTDKHLVEDNLLIGANAFLQTSAGRFIFQKRSFNAGTLLDKVGLFGGGIDDNEGAEKCIIRELAEELELKVTKKQLEIFGDFPHPRHEGKYTRIYIIKNVEAAGLVLHEGDGIVEYLLTELGDVDMTPLAQSVVKQLLLKQPHDLYKEVSHHYYSTAAALLKTSDGQFLFQKRAQNQKSNAGKICLFGGHIEGGESPEEGLIRELAEELELQITDKEIIYITDFIRLSQHEKPFGRKFLIENIDEKTLTLHEGEAIVKMSIEEAISHPDLTSSTQRTLEYYLQNVSDKEIKVAYTCEPKYDGISIELVYEHGQFVQAITRGDGYIGEDITENVRTLLSVPFYLQDKSIASLRLRGEIVMTKKAFERVNKEREQNAESLFANPRNATSGSLRQLDTSVTAKRGLICYVYEILEGLPTEIEQHEDSLKFLEKQGFLVFPWIKHCSTIETVITLCTDPHTKQKFDSREIEFDGIVVKVNDISLREILGETNHHPRWAIAYKFPAKQVVTRLSSVDWQVGRTGILTPTANLEAVMLSGVTIARASLHNAEFIREKDIKLHDSVWIQRSGEVIPYVVAPVSNARTGKEQEIAIPEKCPVCQTPVVRSKTDIHIYCPNATCPAQIKGKLAYRVSRDAMNIDGVGDSIIESLVDQGLVANVADLYTLEQPQKRIQMMAMPLIGQRKFQLISDELRKSKNNALRRVINGLGIQHIGKKTAQIIVEAIAAKGYSEKKDFSIEDLERLLTNEEFLTSIKGIGPETIISLKVRFSNQDNKTILDKLVESGINFSLFDLRKKTIEGKLSGKSFCITGTFEIPRKVIGEILAKHGGVLVENLTQSTDFLIVGDNPSSKLDKAKDQANTIIVEGLDKLETRFPFLTDDIKPMKLFAEQKEKKKKEAPKQQGLFG